MSKISLSHTNSEKSLGLYLVFSLVVMVVMVGPSVTLRCPSDMDGILERKNLTTISIEQFAS